MTRSSVFVDLDGCLVKSFSVRELESSGYDALECRPTYAGIVSRLRPGVEGMLSRVSEHADVYLFTAAQLGYAKSVLGVFDLGKYFRKCYTTVYHGPRTISDDLRLTGRPWVLVDDLEADDPMAVYKLHCLGLRPELCASPDYVDRYYAKVSSYCPHHPGPPDTEMDRLAEIVEGKIQSLQKRLILY